MTGQAEISIQPATEADLPFLVAISASAGAAAHWTGQQWADIFGTEIPRRSSWIAWASEDSCRRLGPGDLGAASSIEAAQGSFASLRMTLQKQRGAAAGFLVAQCDGPDWELENIAVAEPYRRRGVASALLSVLRQAAREAAAKRILLEVRASNQAAISLYQRAGFAHLGRRPGYYSRPPEDALILVHLL